MSAPAPAVRAKPRIPLYVWAWWMVLLVAGILVFYVVFTPIWMGIRLVAWLAEGRSSAHRTPRNGKMSRGRGR